MTNGLPSERVLVKQLHDEKELDPFLVRLAVDSGSLVRAAVDHPEIRAAWLPAEGSRTPAARIATVSSNPNMTDRTS